MRLVSRKIWRAFPELDQYDDATCRRYMARARRTRNMTHDFVLTWGGAVLGLVFAIIFASPHYHALHWVSTKMIRSPHVGVMIDTFLILLVFVSFLWFPLLVGFRIRDHLLARSIRKHLDGAICPDCHYSLIGLELFGHEDARRVKCPECGREFALRHLSLSEFDINPNLLKH